MSKQVNAAKLLSIILLAFALSFLQNRLLWGFWTSRPTLSDYLDDMDNLLGLSALVFDPETLSASLQPKPESLNRMMSFCSPPMNECLEGSLLLKIEQEYGDLTEAPDINIEVLKSVWDQLLGRSCLRQLEGTGKPQMASGIPESGLVIHFTRGSQEYILLASRTSEISNDRHRYFEVLIKVNSNRIEVVRCVSFYFEIAGIEDVTWKTLLPVNLAVLLAGWIIVKLRAKT